jgi:hypothetical protein
MSGVFEAFFDFGGDAVAGVDFPFVEPDADAVGFEAGGQVVDGGFVEGAVTEEDIVCERVCHMWGMVTGIGGSARGRGKGKM